MTTPTILVGGIGNIFLGDDGFGVEVARRMSGRALSEGVRVTDFGIRGYDLAFALLDAPGLTILVDAVHRGGRPGTLYTIDLDSVSLDSADPQPFDGHRLDVMQVLRMAAGMGGKLGRILMVGCEPATFGPEEGGPEEGGPEEGWMGLSPAVAAAVDRAVEIVESLIDRNGIVQTPLVGVTA